MKRLPPDETKTLYLVGSCKTFSCRSCPQVHELDMYAAAHTHVELIHVCTCGQESFILGKIITQPPHPLI